MKWRWRVSFFFYCSGIHSNQTECGHKAFWPDWLNGLQTAQTAVVTHTLMRLRGLPLQHWPCCTNKLFSTRLEHFQTLSASRQRLKTESEKLHFFSGALGARSRILGEMLLLLQVRVKSGLVFKLEPVQVMAFKVTWRSAKLWAVAWQIGYFWHVCAGIHG